MFKVTSFVCLLIFAFSATLDAQTSPSVVAEPIDDASPMYYNHGSHVARTSDGKLFVVWQDPANDGQIVYSQYDPSFQIWNPAVALSSNPSGGTVDKTAIAADDNGNLYCVWQQRNTSGDDYMVMLSKYDGSTWSVPADLTGSNLENEEYLKLILNGCSTLGERFSQIDDKIVREQLRQVEKNQGKISPELKAIIEQSDLPEKISKLFLGNAR